MDLNGILQAMRVPGMERVFVLGSFERRVTIYSQQVRALNLIEALRVTDKIKQGTSVAVVGAGVAGLTAAAAAAHLGGKVTMIERSAGPLPLFRRSPNRWLHPFIYDWPVPGWDGGRAGLPLLDWGPGTVTQVVEELDREWQKHASNVTTLYDAKNVWLSATASDVQMNWNIAESDDDDTSGGGTFEIVILAVGFGAEQSTLPGHRSYWEHDDLDQDKGFNKGDKRRTWLVSGAGDGALTDVLRLCLKDFRHEHMVRDFVSDPKMSEAIEKVKLIEADPKAGDATNPKYLSDAYNALDVPFVIEELKRRRRPDTKVTLNAPSPHYFTQASSVLNRFLLSQLRRAGAFRFLPGAVLPTTAKDGDLIRVDFKDAPSETFDRVVLRHGPKSTIEQWFPSIWNATKSYRDTWRQAPMLLDRTRERLWKTGTFGLESRTNRTAGSVTMRNVPSRVRRARDILRKLGPDGSMGVAVVEPLGFCAGMLIEEVLAQLNRPNEALLAVRLAPDLGTTDEERFYETLLRDLRDALTEPWRQFVDARKDVRAIERFEYAVEDLLEGPVVEARRTLLLVIDDLSRVPAALLEKMGFLLARLTGKGLKLLVWGGQELHELRTRPPANAHYSAFHVLQEKHIGVLSYEDVELLVIAHGGVSVVAGVVYAETGGHPMLVKELLEGHSMEVFAGDRAAMTALIRDSAHLAQLRQVVTGDPLLQETLRGFAAMAGKPLVRGSARAEVRLEWLGILEDAGPRSWHWVGLAIQRFAGEWA